MENRTKKSIAVINAYTNRIYNWFATDEAARDYMKQMLLKEPDDPPGVCPLICPGGRDWIWVYDARGVEGV